MPKLPILCEVCGGVMQSGEPVGGGPGPSHRFKNVCERVLAERAEHEERGRKLSFLLAHGSPAVAEAAPEIGHSDLLLKCQCCGHEGRFPDAEAAFAAGWDAPPHFTGYVACNLCPGSFAAFPELFHSSAAFAVHQRQHAYWREHGRPSEFEIPDGSSPAAGAPVPAESETPLS